MRLSTCLESDEDLQAAASRASTWTTEMLFLSFFYFQRRRERERGYKVLHGAPPYISPIPPSIPCLSTAHVTSPRCHGDGSTCCRQEVRGKGVQGGKKRVKRGVPEGKKGKKVHRQIKKRRKDEQKIRGNFIKILLIYFSCFVTQLFCRLIHDQSTE